MKFAKFLKTPFLQNTSGRLLLSIICYAGTFREKVDEVNTHLEEICAKKEIGIITHGNVNEKRYLNKSILYLSNVGISTFLRNFKTFLKSLD